MVQALLRFSNDPFHISGTDQLVQLFTCSRSPRRRSYPRKTVNQIADKLGVAFWQVRHVVNSRRGIEPAVTHRSVKLYDTEGVRQIKVELETIEAQRAKRRAVYTR